MPTFSIRTDPEIDAALDRLGVTAGNRSKIVKQAILLLDDQTRRQNLREESERLAADPADRAEMQAVRNDLEALRAR